MKLSESPIYILTWCQEYCQGFERKRGIRIITFDVSSVAAALWIKHVINAEEEAGGQKIASILLYLEGDIDY